MGETMVAPSSALEFEQALLSRGGAQPILKAPIELTTAPTQAALVPTKRLTLERLPTELHFQIFSHLDTINRTVLGLTSRHFYSAYRLTLPRLNPPSPSTTPTTSQSVTAATENFLASERAPLPLSTRRVGKNKLEYAFNRHTPGSSPCRFCKVERCQLWRHLDELFPSDKWEFCGVRERFAPRIAGEGHNEGCWRSCPPVPRRCGRHSSVVAANAGLRVSRI